MEPVILPKCSYVNALRLMQEIGTVPLLCIGLVSKKSDPRWSHCLTKMLMRMWRRMMTEDLFTEPLEILDCLSSSYCYATALMSVEALKWKGCPNSPSVLCNAAKNKDSGCLQFLQDRTIGIDAELKLKIDALNYCSSGRLQRACCDLVAQVRHQYQRTR